jgi:hypothetical protein
VTEQEALTALDSIDLSHPEEAHMKADRVLLALAPKSVQTKLKWMQSDSDWWYS